MTSPSLCIELTSLTKSYGPHRGIVDVDLAVRPGEVVGLVGANGAGKTTLMRTLLDFVRPTRGSARILGMDSVEKSVAVRRLSTYLPGELVLPPRLSGYATLRRFMFARDDVPLKRVQEVADRLGLDLSRKVGDLSKGNKQKLGLVLAFAPQARLLILDEPTSGLDPILQREFAGMVREATDTGATVLLSSHVMSEVEQVATRVALMREGRLTAYQDMSTILSGARRRGRARTVDPNGTRPLADDLSATPGVSDVEVVDASGANQSFVAFACAGSVDPVVRTLSRHSLASLDLTHADLDDAFFSRPDPEKTQ
jgi:beta-exotoxin I transport system ATP-binding protein